MTYSYQNWETSQVRLFRHDEPNTAVSIAVFNKRKKRVYIHNIEKLDDYDIDAIKEFIKLMKKEKEEVK